MSSRRSDTLPLLILLGASLGMNVFLARRLEARGSASGGFPLQIGARAPDFYAHDHAGNVVKIDLAAQPTVIYVFRPDCEWCARNAANFRTLARALRQRFRLVAVDLRAPGAAGELDLPLAEAPELYLPTSQSATAFSLGATPETIVVDQGRFRKVWMGAYTGETAKAVGRYFGVTLPGLVAAGRAQGSCQGCRAAPPEGRE